MADTNQIAGPAWSSQRIAVVSISGAWGLYVAFKAIRLAIMSFPRELMLLEWHLITASAGACLTWMLGLALWDLVHASIFERIAGPRFEGGFRVEPTPPLHTQLAGV